MSRSATARTGAQLLVECLLTHGADTAFGVPGESYLALLDALHDVQNRLRFVICRQEGGAANMADAYAKLTGKPALCLVTRGPGAANAAVGVHTAFQDSTPMIVLIGQVARYMKGREAFQEVDYPNFYGELTKWTAEIDDPDRIPELVSRAFHVACTGRPDPVALALPEDMLDELTEAQPGDPYVPARSWPGAPEMERLRTLLAEAERPLLVIGGGSWSAEASRDITAFAENNNLPVVCSFRCQDYIDNTHRLYCGDAGAGMSPVTGKLIREADLVIAAGPRLGEMTTQDYGHVKAPRPDQTLVHVHASSDELGRVYMADLKIHADLPLFCAAAAALDPVDCAAWAKTWAVVARNDHVADFKLPDQPGPVDMRAVMKCLRETLPPDTVVCTGAGNYAIWAQKQWLFKPYRTQIAPTSGAMGYGVPAAVAAKMVHPDRTVLSFNGDGCFLMNGQDLATAVQYGLDPIFLVVNNGMYGTIRMHQERHYPGRVFGTELANPDFAALARAYGAHGERVDKTEDFAPALERARAAGKASLIEIVIDGEVITPRATLTGIREAAQRRKDG